MRTRSALFLLITVTLAPACRRAEPPAPSPSPRADLATTPTPSPTPTAAATPEASPSPAAAKAAPGPAAFLLAPEKATAKAPDTYRVRFETSKGRFVVEVQRDWAPRGADRFYNLVRAGYYDDVAFFRVIDDFMVQFGINGDPSVNAVWREARIPDDPVKQSNVRGMVTFATSGPDSRTTQVFINFKDNSRLDTMGFAPFGKVVEGMAVVDSLYSGYGEGAPRGRGPDQGRAQGEGNAYIRGSFPKLDFVKTARIATPGKGAS
jgi:peptidyl-prolyl cis-trans isomerase A (cyclophilin A)